MSGENVRATQDGRPSKTSRLIRIRASLPNDHAQQPGGRAGRYVTKGVALVDESARTGIAEAVLREPGGDREQRRPRFGTANPERMRLAFWEWMIRGDDTPPTDEGSVLGQLGLMMRAGILKSGYGPPSGSTSPGSMPRHSWTQSTRRRTPRRYCFGCRPPYGGLSIRCG
jgi:hypothetical protein